MDEEENFFDTEQGQFISGAAGYLLTAKVTLASTDYCERRAALLRPVLHNAGLGVELLCKFVLSRQGVSAGEIGNVYGHELTKLWELPQMAGLRTSVSMEARLVWEQARASGRWPDKFKGDPVEVLEKGLKVLSRLYGRETRFRLRYPGNFNVQAPRPRLIVGAFHETAERLLRNPGLLD